MPSDAGVIVSDASTSGGLQWVDPPTQSEITLQPSERYEVQVRLVDTSGQPVPAESVLFGLEGAPGSTSLRNVSEETDDEGIARTEIIAGPERASFSLNVSARGYPPLSRVFRVEAAGFGIAEIVVTRPSTRSIARTEVRALDGTIDCAAAAELESPRHNPTANDRVTIPSLRVDQRYTLEAVGVSLGGTVVARGCVGDVAIARDTPAYVTIPLEPLPLWSDRTTFDVEFNIRHTEDPSDLVTSILNVITDTIQAFGLAPSLVEETRRQLLARGITPPTFVEGQTTLSARLALVESPLQPIEDLLTQSGTMSQSFRVEMDLALHAGTPDSQTPSTVVASLGLESVLVPMAGSETWVELPLGFGSDRPRLTATWQRDTDTFDSVSFAIPLSPAELATATAETIGRQDGSLTTNWEVCQAYQTWVQSQRQLGPLCDQSCIFDTCTEVGLDLLRPLAGEGVRPIQVFGSVVASDSNGDRQIDGLRGDFDGNWENSGTIQGLFVASEIP